MERGERQGWGTGNRWGPGKTSILNRIVMEGVAEKVTSEQRKRK